MKKVYLALLALVLSVSAMAQMAPKACSDIPKDEKKAARPSPPACTDVKFADGKMISIEYSRPGAKGRVVWGQLVPWDKEWRMGANEMTSFTTNTDVMVGGTKVPAGSYSLDLVPQQNGPWKLVINKTTGQWGIPYPGAASDLARIDMKTSPIQSPVELFTMKLAPAKGSSTTLTLQWEKTQATVDIKEAK